jgi:hypothetical protein
VREYERYAVRMINGCLRRKASRRVWLDVARVTWKSLVRVEICARPNLFSAPSWRRDQLTGAFSSGNLHKFLSIRMRINDDEEALYNRASIADESLGAIMDEISLAKHPSTYSS